VASPALPFKRTSTSESGVRLWTLQVTVAAALKISVHAGPATGGVVNATLDENGVMIKIIPGTVG
jgi:hypothetical protein